MLWQSTGIEMSLQDSPGESPKLLSELDPSIDISMESTLLDQPSPWVPVLCKEPRKITLDL